MNAECTSLIPRRRFRSDILILSQFLLLGVSILLAWYCAVFSNDPSSLTYALSTWLVALYIWSLLSWRLACGRLFDPYILFFTSVTLFNGGHAFLEVLGLNKNGVLGGKFSPATTANTLCLVALALASLHLGGLVGCFSSRSKESGSGHCLRVEQDDTSCLSARIVGWSLVAISIVPFFAEMRRTVGVVMSYGYFGIYQQAKITGVDSLPRILGGFFIPGIMFLTAGSKHILFVRISAALIVFMYSGLSLFLGRRSRGGYTLISYAWLWDRLIAPLPKTLLAISGFILLFVVFPSIKVVRNISATQRLSMGYVLEAFLSIESPAVAIISEIGGSMGTIAHTMELVPSVRPFDMGVGYLYALLTLLPNLFWDIHPSISRGTGGHWLVWTVEPMTAAVGGGLGFSVIAEAYLNFGWAGVPIVMGIIGFLLGRVVEWSYRSPDPGKAAFLACILASILGLARSETADVVRSIVWYGLLPYALVSMIRRFARKSG